MRRRSSAFSLLELVLVVLILASIAAIAGVRLSAGIASDRLAAATRDLAATLRLAADRAALTGLEQRVVLSGGAPGSLRVEEQAEPLDKPESWSSPGLSWTQPRTLHPTVVWTSLVLDPDDEQNKLELPLAEQAVELALVYSPDGRHRLVRLDEKQALPEDDEERAVELKVSSTVEGETPLYLRIEISGRVRILTEAERTAEIEERDAAK